VNDPERDVNVAAGINQRRAQRPNQALYTSDLVSCTAISETRGPLLGDKRRFPQLALLRERLVPEKRDSR
jgi:hypothetical protein